MNYNYNFIMAKGFTVKAKTPSTAEKTGRNTRVGLR